MVRGNELLHPLVHSCLKRLELAHRVSKNRCDGGCRCQHFEFCFRCQNQPNVRGTCNVPKKLALIIIMAVHRAMQLHSTFVVVWITLTILNNAFIGRTIGPFAALFYRIGLHPAGTNKQSTPGFETWHAILWSNWLITFDNYLPSCIFQILETNSEIKQMRRGKRERRQRPANLMPNLAPWHRCWSSNLSAARLFIWTNISWT